MRLLLLMISFVVSSTFISCENKPETTAQIEQQAQTTTNPIKDTIVAETLAETKVVETAIEAPIKAEPVKPKKRPILSFDNKNFDYGMIEQGESVNHTFRFTNKGNSNLIIKNAEASCGCTVPTYPFTPIAPGQTGTISVTFNSTGKMGTQRPNIRVISNAYPRTQTLYLEGFVTHQVVEKEKEPLIEEDVNINKEGNTAKGEIEETDN